MKLKILALLALLTGGVHISYSQNPAEAEGDTVLLNDIVIEENRLSYSFSEASRNVEIITKKEITNTPAQSLPEILSYQAGVDIRQRGPAGVQADIGIRGGSFEQTLVLLNGIKMSDPQTGHHLLNVPLMQDNLERIEVLKGPAARIYGQNAYAGAVNFVTKVPETNAIRFRGYGGDFATWGGNLSASFNNGIHGHYLSIGRDRSNGYRHNTDYKMLNGFYQGEFNVGKNSRFDVIAAATQRKFGANGFYASPAATEQYEEVRTAVASVAYTYKNEKWKISPRFSWRNNRDRYDYLRDDPGVYQNLHYTNTYALETNISYRSALGTTGIGLEYRNEEIKGDWMRGGIPSKSNLDGFSRDNFGAFVEHKFSFVNDKLDITPGTYIGWYSDFGTQLFPGIEAGYNVAGNVRIYGNVGRSFRIPTFYDQYYESPTELGNPELKPEEAWTYEAGMRFIDGGWMLEVNGFFRDNQNMIDWVMNQDSVWTARNFAMVETTGVELTVAYNRPIPIIENEVALENISATYNKLGQEMNSREATSRYALEHLADQLIISADLQLYRNLKSGLVFRYIDRVEKSAYSLFDGRIYWEDENFNVFAEATNITNTQYTEVMTPMPGRWFRAGVILNVPY